jgi:hypothetical protein
MDNTDTKVPAKMDDDELLYFLLDASKAELFFHYSNATNEQLQRWERVLDEYSNQLNKSHLVYGDPPTQSIH